MQPLARPDFSERNFKYLLVTPAIFVMLLVGVFPLIYLLLVEHAIEIVADRGIARKVSEQEWAAMTQRMSAAFREGRFEDGLTQALSEVSALLVAHFPLAPGEQDGNELPDAPVVI